MIENENINLFLDTWEILKTYIPMKDRIEAAEHVIQILDRYNIDIELHASELSENCSVLAKAVDSMVSYQDIYLEEE